MMKHLLASLPTKKRSTRLHTFITNDIYNLKNIVVSTIVFSTMMGFSRLKQFKNMEVYGIDEIELNQIVGDKNFI